MFFNTTKQIWNAPKQMFAQDQNVSCIYHLYFAIFLCQQDDKSLGEYYVNLEGLWELNVYHPLTNNMDVVCRPREEFRIENFPIWFKSCVWKFQE